MAYTGPVSDKTLQLLSNISSLHLSARSSYNDAEHFLSECNSRRKQAEDYLNSSNNCRVEQLKYEAELKEAIRQLREEIALPAVIPGTNPNQEIMDLTNSVVELGREA